MTNDQDIWVPLYKAMPLLEAAYTSRYDDNRLRGEAAAFAALTRRLADGTLRARPKGFTYFIARYGAGADRETINTPLSDDGCVPIEFWHDFNEANNPEHDPHAGDFKFSIGHVDFAGHTDGLASGISVNWNGLPIIGDEVPPAAYANAPEPNDEADQPLKSKGGRKPVHDTLHALIYLAAYAHHSVDGLTDNPHASPSTKGIARILQGAFEPEKTPGDTWLKELAGRVLDEINIQDRQGGRKL